MKKSLKYIILLSLLIIVFLGYRYFKVIPEITNLNNGITVLGHRGMSTRFEYPGNSLPSILEALRLGADGCELDVQITKDGKLVAYHNKILDGHTDAVGMISEYPLESIEATRYTGPFQSEVFIVSIDELFSTLDQPQKYYFSFDCKFYGLDDNDPMKFYSQFVDALETLVSNHDMQGRIFIESSEPEFHKILKDRNTGALQFITGHGPEKGSRIALDLDLYGVGVGSSVSGKEIDELHAKDLRVMTWTPRNAFENIRAVRKNPDIIQTADLNHLLKFLRKN